MPLALTLRLDEPAAQIVWEIWDGLAAAGIGRDLLDLGYPPHVTLALAEDDATPVPALSGCLPEARKVTVTFAGIGLFPGWPCWCWLAIVPDAMLLDIQRRAARALHGATGHPHYRPGAWIPHVTLASLLPDEARLARATLWLHQHVRPFSATLDRLELVRFPPPAILASRALA